MSKGPGVGDGPTGRWIMGTAPQQSTDCPAVPGLPVIGNTLQVLRDPGGFFPKAYRKYGPVFRVKVAGTRYTVLAGSEAVDFYNRNGESHLSRARFYDRFGRELGTDQFVLGQPPDAQRDLRKKIRRGLSRQVAASFVPDMIAAVDRTLDATPAGTPVPALETFGAISFEQYGHLLCNRSIRHVLGDAQRFTRHAMNVGTRLWPGIALQDPRYRRSRRRVFHFLHDLLARQRDVDSRAYDAGSDHRPYTLLDALLAARTDDGEPVPEQEVIACSLYGFVGSLVYMDRAIAYLLYHLLSDEQLKRRAIAEADEAFADGRFDIASARELRFLRASFQEAMRYRPIALALPFVVEKDFEYAGHVVPAGEFVVISGVPMMFSETYHACPHAFDPDRYLPPRDEQRNPGAFVPFGIAPRFCPATSLVELMATCTVARLLHRREVRLAQPGEPLAETLNPLPGPTRRFAIEFGEERHATPRKRSDTAADTLADVVAGGDATLPSDLFEGATTETHDAGTTVVREGDTAEAFYIVLDGEVEVTRTTTAGETGLARLQPGDYFGEIGLLEAGRRTATCRATESGPLRVLVVSRADFLQAVEDSDLIAQEISAVARRRFLTGRLRQALPSIDPATLPQQLERAEVRQAAPGEDVVREGEPAQDFYVVLKGGVRVIRDCHGRPADIADLGPGQCFGEIGLLEGRPRNATVRADESRGAELLALPRAAFLDLIEGSPDTQRDLATLVYQRLLDGLDAHATAGNTGGYAPADSHDTPERKTGPVSGTQGDRPDDE